MLSYSIINAAIWFYHILSHYMAGKAVFSCLYIIKSVIYYIALILLLTKNKVF